MWQALAALWATGCPLCKLNRHPELDFKPTMQYNDDPTGWNCSVPFKHLCWGHSRNHYEDKYRALRSPDGANDAWRVRVHLPQNIVRDANFCR